MDLLEQRHTNSTSQAILHAAQQTPTGTWAGQCKRFVGSIVQKVTAHYPTGYQQGFAAAGARAVTAAQAGPGDIIQVTPAGSNDATVEQLHTGRNLHTAIIVTNHGNGTFDVIDSNWLGHERVRRHTFNPYTWAKAGSIIKIWSF